MYKTLWATVLFLILVAQTFGNGLQGQEPQVIHADVLDLPDRVFCGQCSIQIRHTVRIGSPEEDGAFYTQPLAVLQLPGVGFVISESEGGRLLAFDEEGEFLKVVGRPGQGPGEILGPGPLARIGGDSVAVVDYGNGRIAILDPDSLTLKRTVRIDVRLTTNVAAFQGHKILSNGVPTDPGRIGLPLHTIELSQDPVGVHSFGSVDGLAVSDFQQERLVSFGGGGVWSLRRSEYFLEKWNLVTGERLQAFRLRPSWFETPSRGSLGLPDQPPQPRMEALRADDEERLWVFGLSPAPNWEEAWAHVGPLAGRRELVGSERPHYEKMFSTQVEIVDPGEGARMTTFTWNRKIGGVLDDGRVWTLDRDDLDRFFIDIWEVALLTNGG